MKRIFTDKFIDACSKWHDKDPENNHPTKKFDKLSVETQARLLGETVDGFEFLEKTGLITINEPLYYKELDGVFRFFEAQEGGMDSYKITYLSDLEQIPYWMASTTKQQDQKLLDWMLVAEMGECYDHRMGTCVRVKE